MRTLVLVLAQGQQSRLPDLPVAKQLLRLPACGNAPILYRTCHQVWRLLGERTGQHDVRLVTWLNVYEALVREPAFPLATTLTVLGDPGNSSLKGLHAVLSGFVGDMMTLERFDQIVVLLGDVVYSWKCLRAIFDPTAPVRFVGTSDLGRATGELWGFAWHEHEREVVARWIHNALEHHPKFSAYQPGQLRRVLWEMQRERMQGALGFVAIDDYTRDIDLPEHVAQIPQLAQAARADDADNGLPWRDA